MTVILQLHLRHQWMAFVRYKAVQKFSGSPESNWKGITVFEHSSIPGHLGSLGTQEIQARPSRAISK